MTTIRDPLLDPQKVAEEMAVIEDFPESTKPPKKACYLKRVSTNYDKSFTFNYGAIFFNNGITQTFCSVCLQQILKVNYGLGVNANQMSLTFIFLPWDFKILYGIICDTVRPPGFQSSPRRGYLIYQSIFQGVLLLVVGLYEFKTAAWVVNLLMVFSISSAFLDAVINGICCVQ